MANTLADRYTLSQDAPFKQRVQQAVITAAIDVTAEAEATAFHVRRLALARRILADPSGLAALFASGCAANATIALTAPTGLTATDGDIQFTVNSLFNAYTTS